MLKLYKYLLDCGRHGELDGLFVATPEQIKRIIGQEIYFGEVLGKHSEVIATIEAHEITEILDDEQVVLKLVEAVGGYTICGYNPLDFYDESEK